MKAIKAHLSDLLLIVYNQRGHAEETDLCKYLNLKFINSAFSPFFMNSLHLIIDIIL